MHARASFRLTAERDKPNAAATLSAVGILALSQLVFWLMLGAAESRVKPSGVDAPASVSLHLTEDWQQIANTPAIAVPKVDEPAYFFEHDHGGMPAAVFAHRFNLASTDRELGLLLNWQHAITEIRVNGNLLKPQTALDRWGLLGGFDLGLYIMPREDLRAGENLLTLTVVGNRSKILPAFYLSDADAALVAHGWGQLLTSGLVIAATAVMLFVALLWALVYWPGGVAMQKVGIVTLLLAWSLRNLAALNLDAGLPPLATILVHYGIAFGFLLALALFAGFWTGAGIQSVRRVLLLLVAVAGVSFVGIQVTTDNGLSRDLFGVETVLTLSACGYAFWRFARFNLGSLSLPARFESVLFLICISAVFYDAIDDRFAIHVPGLPELALTFYAAPACGLLLALGSAVVLAAQSSRARRTVTEANEKLQQALSAQSKELEGFYLAKEADEKARARLAERQRIMRDMHDGVGGQLAGLIARVRNEDVSLDDVDDALSDGLRELRLIVDSLDTAGESLPLALGAFRSRLQPSLDAAGVTLDWQVDDRIDDADLSPRAVLNVYRILQEACSNVLQHARAKRVRIALQRASDGILLSVEDDGIGLSEDRPAGRGLENLSARAAELGAELDIGNADTRGVRVALRLADKTAPDTNPRGSMPGD